MDIEAEIENIINNVHHKEIYSFKEIAKLREIVIHKAYEEFLMYPENSQNLQESILELEDYEFVDDPENLIQGDEIKMPDFKHFFNMKLLDLSFTRLNNDGTIHIKQNSAYKDIPCEFVFRKLTDDDKIKISLMEVSN